MKDRPLPLAVSRREALTRCGLGMAGLSLGLLLGEEQKAHAARSPLAATPPHFAPRAKRVIHLFLNGGLSHLDSFDYKPALAKHAGKALPELGPDGDDRKGIALPSPFAFKRYGSNGLMVSDLFENLGRKIDEVCVVQSMHTDSPEHGDARQLWHCGSIAQNSPSAGAWVTYGLGSENESLPAFVALCPGNGQLPEDGSTGWRAGFMPPIYQGTLVDTGEIRDVEKLIRNVRNPFLSGPDHRRQIDLLHKLNRRHLAERGGDPTLEGRIQSYEMAYRMQSAATEAFDLAREPDYIHRLYGDTKPAQQMLLARRLIERGVRFVQVWPYHNQPFDSHENLTSLEPVARHCDRAISALLTDLSARGLLDETLVVMCGEFGRMPTAQGEMEGTVRTGRNHNPHCCNVILAGGGIRSGIVFGASDEFGYRAVEDPVHVNDLQATMLHLLGINHEQLTYHHAGRDYRLTNLGGNVVKGMLA
ncbi:MAG: DUF1501 domain-containing protein [Pirellulales bacterium]|jgi:hypothetical protein|nr:DUF1501 domain-containing protein [Pirellulales bacterium]